MRFSETPVRAPVAAPVLGADTATALARLLGLSAEAIAGLAAAGAIPPLGIPPRANQD